MDTTNSIFEDVRRVIAETLGIALADIKRDSELLNDLGAQSLDAVEIVMAVEEKFDVEIEEKVANKIVTVGDIVECIEKLTALQTA